MSAGISQQLRAPPLLFGRNTSESNYPPNTLSAADHGSTLEHQTLKGWYFKVGSMQTGVHTSKPPTYPHQGSMIKCQAIVRVHGVFPSCRGYLHLHSRSSISLVSGGQLRPSLRHSCGSNLPTRRNFATLRTVIVYGRRLPGLRSGSFALR